MNKNPSNLEKIFIFFISSLSITLFACNKKNIGPQFEEGSILSGYKVFIANEGNFGFSNATISAYNPYKKEVSNNFFVSKNGFNLGDIIQSLSFYKGEVFIVINNGGKVIVADSLDLSYKYEINGLVSPRYISFYQNLAFITDLKSNKVSVLNLDTHQIEKQISINGWTEQMIVLGNHLYFYSRGNYLNNQGSNKIYKYNISNEFIVDSLVVGFEPNSLLIDKNEDLWVLCSGGINQYHPHLQKINVNNFLIEKDYVFSSISESPFRLVINEEGDNLYFLNNHVYRMSINSQSLPNESFLQANGRNFYGLNISPNNEIYLTDAKDYQQKGKIYRYYENKEIIDEFEVGIIPQYIAF